MEDAKMASCPNCGQEVGRDFAFCPSCAADLRVHPRRPPVPSERRQRRIAMAISVGIVLALIVVALLVTTQSVSSGLPIQTTSSAVTASPLLEQTDSIMTGNYAIRGVLGANSSIDYQLSIWVMNTGSVSITDVAITVVPPSYGSPTLGPSCTFSRTVSATQQMEPGATVIAICTGSPYVRGGEYMVTVVGRNGVNPGMASWSGQIYAT